MKFQVKPVTDNWFQTHKKHTTAYHNSNKTPTSFPGSLFFPPKAFESLLAGRRETLGTRLTKPQLSHEGYATKTNGQTDSRGNQCRFQKIFAKALEEFLNRFIQSETSPSTHEYSESNRASKFVCCLATSGTNTAGSVPFRFNWYLFPRLNILIYCVATSVRHRSGNVSQPHDK